MSITSDTLYEISEHVKSFSWLYNDLIVSEYRYTYQSDANRKHIYWPHCIFKRSGKLWIMEEYTFRPFPNHISTLWRNLVDGKREESMYHITAGWGKSVKNMGVTRIHILPFPSLFHDSCSMRAHFSVPDISNIYSSCFWIDSRIFHVKHLVPFHPRTNFIFSHFLFRDLSDRHVSISHSDGGIVHEKACVAVTTLRDIHAHRLNHIRS